MVDDAKAEEEDMSRAQIERKIKVGLFQQIIANCPEFYAKDLAKGFGVSPRTATRWLNDEIDQNP